MTIVGRTGIVVRYIYSACVVTKTKDARVLHDPWFTEGIYDGSWFHFPKIENPLASIGDVDLIYVSHIHPDHYDDGFLQQYFATYGVKPILIADHDPNHLARKMKADGLDPRILTEAVQIGDTTIEIIPHRTGSVSDIDSAIVVKFFDGQRQHCVANANDIIFDELMIERLKKSAGGADILLCGYTGAGPYPQTYFDVGDPRLADEATKKKLNFFERYRGLTGAIGARVNIPFAGKYVLGGRLSSMNEFRGVADAVEVTEFDKHAIVLADEGGEIDTTSLEPTAVRGERYSKESLQKRIEEISGLEMDYERLIRLDEIGQLPIRRLLVRAAKRASEYSECIEDYFFVFDLGDGWSAIVNANRAAKNLINIVRCGAALPQPRSEIRIDLRYLFGLLTGIYHWNNAEVGSQYDTRRHPNRYNESAQRFLHYLSI